MICSSIDSKALIRIVLKLIVEIVSIKTRNAIEKDSNYFNEQIFIKNLTNQYVHNDDLKSHTQYD